MVLIFTFWLWVAKIWTSRKFPTIQYVYNYLSVPQCGIYLKQFLLPSLLNLPFAPSAPSGAPLTVSVFLSYLHSSAQFQWGHVPQEKQNGPVTNYRLSCRSSTNSRLQIQENFNSSVFQFELANLEPGTKYECSVSASTAAGRGPESTPVKFTTPTGKMLY